MKRFVLLLLVFLGVFVSGSDLIKLGEITTYDTGISRSYRIVVRFNPLEGSEYIYLDADEGSFEYQIKLNSTNIGRLRDITNKILEWQDTAVTHKVKTTVKKTVEGLVYSEIWWRTGAKGDVYYAPSFTMEGTFMYVNPKISGVVLVMSNPSSRSNPYIRPDMKDRFIFIPELRKLKNILNPEYIEQEIVNFTKEQTVIDDLFQ